MSGKLEKTLNQTFGCPTEYATTQIDFTATAASGQLFANEVYRLAPSEDCYISFIKVGGAVPSAADANATSSGVLMFGGVPEVFSTTDRETYVSVVRKTTNGELVITRLKTRQY